MSEPNRRFMGRLVDIIQGQGVIAGIDTNVPGGVPVYSAPCSVEATPFSLTLGNKRARRIDSQVVLLDPDGNIILPPVFNPPPDQPQKRVDFYAYAHDCDFICNGSTSPWPNPPFTRRCPKDFHLVRLVGALENAGTVAGINTNIPGGVPVYAIADCTNCGNKCCLRPEQPFHDTLHVTMHYVSGGKSCGDGIVVPVNLDPNSIICNAPGIVCPSRGATWQGYNTPFQVRVKCSYVTDGWTIEVKITPTLLPWTSPPWETDVRAMTGTCDPFLFTETSGTLWAQGTVCYDPGQNNVAVYTETLML